MPSPCSFLSVFDARVQRGEGFELQEKRLSGFRPALQPAAAGAALKLRFEGCAISLLRGSPWLSLKVERGVDYLLPGAENVWRPGPTIEGEALEVRIDGGPPRQVDLAQAPLEIPLAEHLPPGDHELELKALKKGRSAFLGFHIFDQPLGRISGKIRSSLPRWLNDVRATLHREGYKSITQLARNPFTEELDLLGVPPGTYDLRIEAVGWQPQTVTGLDVRAGETTELGELTLQTEALRPPRFADTLKRPRRLRIVKFGHMDTWHQRNAEYLCTLVELANLLDPDLLLISNEVNWQYVTGALNRLRAPYLITSGNHGLPEFARYFGADLQTLRIEDVFVASWNRPWDGDLTPLAAAFAQAQDARYRILQGVESGIPREQARAWGVDLYAFGHGFTQDDADRADWLHLGKEFHLVDIDLDTRQAEVIGAEPGIHRGKYPIPRDEPFEPVEVEWPDDTNLRWLRIRAFNPLLKTVHGARVKLRMLAGEYSVSPGRLEAAPPDVDPRWRILSIRVDLSPGQWTTIEVHPQ